MRKRRLANKKKFVNKIKDEDLCSGPSKLCQVCLDFSFDRIIVAYDILSLDSPNNMLK